MHKIPVTRNNRRNNNQTTQCNNTTNREQLKKNQSQETIQETPITGNNTNIQQTGVYKNTRDREQ